MARKSLGYVELEWTCPKCGSRNPGPEKTCVSCGAPQPEDVQFEQVEGKELIKDEETIEKIKAGPDVHCGFCGARNPAGTETCTQCGADLVHGTKREVGRVVGAFKTGPVKEVACPHCGVMNPETAIKCAGCGGSMQLAPAAVPAAAPKSPAKAARKPSPLWMALGGVIVVLCLCAVIVYAVLSARTEGQNAVVQSVHWMTSIAIEDLQPVTYETWEEEIPADATIGSCTQKVHHLQDEPAPNSNEVCGTPYTVDTGTGAGEVVQDCQYEVFMEYCEYTIMEWQQVDEAVLEGNDLSPVWAEPQLVDDQRTGAQSETYSVIFQTNEGQYSYTVRDYNEFQQFQPGSEWVLNINTFGAVVSVEPVR